MSIRFVLAIGLVFGAGNVFAGNYAFKSVKVSGEKEATLTFQLNGDVATLPTYEVKDNTIELTFPGAEISESARDKADLNQPHPLVHRVATFSSDKGAVKTRILVNGTAEDLKDRVKLTKTADGVQVAIAYAKGTSPAAALLSDEDLPIGQTVTTAKNVPKDISAYQIIMLFFVVVLSGAGTYFFVRFMKKARNLGGSRKHLVEQMSYCPLGPKMGVSLLKVGTEFVLVGVTPNQVTFLSNLPKLQTQYDTESAFERDNFKVAVEEELGRRRPNAKPRAVT
jgi:flagellar biogenesis protein FliO